MSHILPWGSFWSYIKRQPDDIKVANLKRVNEDRWLEDVVKYFPAEVVEEILKDAPEDVQKALKYTPKVEKVQPAKSQAPKGRSYASQLSPEQRRRIAELMK